MLYLSIQIIQIMDRSIWSPNFIILSKELFQQVLFYSMIFVFYMINQYNAILYRHRGNIIICLLFSTAALNVYIIEMSLSILNYIYYTAISNKAVFFVIIFTYTAYYYYLYNNNHCNELPYTLNGKYIEKCVFNFPIH